MRQTVQKKNNFYGVMVSPFGVRNGFVDYGTLMKLAEPVVPLKSEEFALSLWELINGDDIFYTDTKGNFYTEETRIERIAELTALIAQTEEKEDCLNYQRDIDSLNRGAVITFHRYLIIPRQVAQILRKESDEVLYYNPQTGIYMWAVPFMAAPEKSLTHIPLR